MGNTYTSLHYHFVFSTKSRRPWISHDIEERVWSYLGGIARENGMRPILIGGMPDHVHIALGLPSTLAVSKAMQQIKGASSKWIKENFPRFDEFAWQDGYGAFSVSKSVLPTVALYIERQAEHHRKTSFQEEFLTLMKLHEIEYDEQYLWD
jgi:REP element-mobilizing transposase RayT